MGEKRKRARITGESVGTKKWEKGRERVKKNQGNTGERGSELETERGKEEGGKLEGRAGARAEEGGRQECDQRACIHRRAKDDLYTGDELMQRSNGERKRGRRRKRRRGEADEEAEKEE